MDGSIPDRNMAHRVPPVLEQHQLSRIAQRLGLPAHGSRSELAGLLLDAMEVDPAVAAAVRAELQAH